MGYVQCYVMLCFILVIWISHVHCVKSIQIRSFFWSVFPRIKNEYGEIGRIWTLFTQWFFQINSADAEMWKNISRKYLLTRTSRVTILSLKIGQWIMWFCAMIICYVIYTYYRYLHITCFFWLIQLLLLTAKLLGSEIED